MDFEKQLANAPQEVKEKVCVASEAAKRYQKACRQVSLWQEEKEIAAALHTASQSDWSDCLHRWNPETNYLLEKENAPIKGQ